MLEHYLSLATKAIFVENMALAFFQIRITVIKGQAGPPAQDPYEVDGLAGATITAYGVSRLVRFWLGENGYGPYLEKLREGV